MGGRWLRRIGAALVTVGGLTVLVALGTGEVALVTTHGISMEPRFHTGDLAVIVPSSPYHVGEIVGYHSPLLDTTVLHRIVADYDGSFTFKGDNNSFLDPQKLPASDIRGRLWLHIPRGGIVLGWVRSPVVLGLLAFFLVALGFGGATRRHRARNPATGPGAPRSGPKHASPGTVGVEWWVVAGPLAVAVVFMVLAVAASSRPTTRPAQRPVPYDQDVSFSYAATAPAGVTYPTGTVSTGDPLFLQLVQDVDVTARYAFSAATPSASRTSVAVSGTIGADAVLQGPNGWSQELGTVAPVAFYGRTASVSLSVDLAQIAALEQSFYAETGVPLEVPDLVITPTVHVRGRLDGVRVVGSDAPSLSFSVDRQEMALSSGASDAISGHSKVLDPVSTGSVERPTSTPASMSVLGRSLTVAGARRIGFEGLLVSLVAAVGGWAWIRRRRRMDDTARIHAAYGHDLVAVSSSPAAQARLVVEVSDFGALARLARRYDCMILELEHPGGLAYYVECGATIYRHGIEPAAGLRSVEDTSRPVDLTYHVTALSSAS